MKKKEARDKEHIEKILGDTSKDEDKKMETNEAKGDCHVRSRHGDTVLNPHPKKWWRGGAERNCVALFEPCG